MTPTKRKSNQKPPFAIKTPLEPMEARAADELPTGPNWQYEPKWDGFRCRIFRSGKQVDLQSKSGQPLGRYFPELVNAVEQVGPKHFVLDGEIIIPAGDRLSFDDLLQRIHPAESRVRKLAESTPAVYVVFDLLSKDRRTPLIARPLAERREHLEKFAARHLTDHKHFRLSPKTTSISQARRWYRASGATLDGVIAKRLDLAYQAGNRDGMLKIKPVRTVECVVGGFRYSSDGATIGSLLLGLYDQQGLLHHVGFTSSFTTAKRKQLVSKLEPLIKPPGFTGHAPGGPSRWSTKRSTEWQPLRTKLVVEVSFDHFTGGRFRHGTQLLRWRPDKPPRRCTLDQVEGFGKGLMKLLAG